MSWTGKEDFIQDYCNSGETLNSSLLKQKARGFLYAEMTQWKIIGGH